MELIKTRICESYECERPARFDVGDEEAMWAPFRRALCAPCYDRWMDYVKQKRESL